MKRLQLGCLATSLSLVAIPSLAGEPHYRFEVVDYPGAFATVVSAVNDRGEIVGGFALPGGAGHAFHGPIGHLAPVDPDGVVGQSAFSAAYTVNNAGVIGGSYSADPSLGRGDHGYLVRDGQVLPVQYPGDLPSEVYGVNDAGQVIGGYFTPDGNVHAFELQDGVFTPQDVPGSLATAPLAINDGGQIVGFYVTVAGTLGHGYVREPDGAVRTFDAPGAAPNSTQLLFVNDGGDELGTNLDPSGNTVTFLRLCGALEPLVAPASLGAATFSPQAINDRGQLAGIFSDENNAFHGFITHPR